MLFKRQILDRIALGEVTLAFRRWRRPSVKAGGRLRTPVGELAILAVEATTPEDITGPDARAAGFADRAEAVKALAAGDGQLYRIAFRLDGEDPRLHLAACHDLDAAEMAAIRAALDDMDRRSRGAAWTDSCLRFLATQPGRPAADLARMSGTDKAVLKRRMRRLKELGLTESLATGYRLSPRGAHFLLGPTPTA
jgi:hypothetical protein